MVLRQQDAKGTTAAAKARMGFVFGQSVYSPRKQLSKVVMKLIYYWQQQFWWTTHRVRGVVLLVALATVSQKTAASVADESRHLLLLLTHHFSGSKLALYTAGEAMRICGNGGGVASCGAV